MNNRLPIEEKGILTNTELYPMPKYNWYTRLKCLNVGLIVIKKTHFINVIRYKFYKGVAK